MIQICLQYTFPFGYALHQRIHNEIQYISIEFQGATLHT